MCIKFQTRLDGGKELSSRGKWNFLLGFQKQSEFASSDSPPLTIEFFFITSPGIREKLKGDSAERKSAATTRSEMQKD